jgi:hypothetical protein
MFPIRSIAAAKIRRRADMENSLFVTDDEIMELANDNLEIAYHHCVAAYGDTCFAAESWISGLGNGPHIPTTWPTGSVDHYTGMGVSDALAVQSRYQLPTNFGRLLRCEWVKGELTYEYPTGSTGALVVETQGAANTRWTPMHPFDVIGSIYDSTPRDWIESEVAYWLTAYPGPDLPPELQPIAPLSVDPTVPNFWIAFLPVPATVVSIHIQYVPIAPAWNDDTSNIRLPELAWKFVREATAADILEKQRSDSSALRGNAALYLADIQNSKLHPDFANPQGTVDIYGGSGIAPYGRRRQVW